MKKLTDEAVAKALGWKRHNYKGGKNLYWWAPGEDQAFDAANECPFFTTDLNAIAGEIEARGLLWEVDNGCVWKPFLNKKSLRPHGMVSGLPLKDRPSNGNSGHIEADTPALALCHALLAYLKENPDEER